VLLLKKWPDDGAGWEALAVEQQERVIGRKKPDSVELEDKPPDAHVASTDQDRFGKIFRRNMPYGTVTDHGTMFVGFSADQRRLSRMLESMAGITSDTRDALTRYTRPITGAYYFVPSTEGLRRAIPRGASSRTAGQPEAGPRIILRHFRHSRFVARHAPDLASGSPTRRRHLQRVDHPQSSVAIAPASAIAAINNDAMRDNRRSRQDFGWPQVSTGFDVD